MIAGSEKVFSAGADVTGTPSQLQEPTLRTVLVRIEDSAKPGVAAINGMAPGGGLELALLRSHATAASRNGLRASASPGSRRWWLRPWQLLRQRPFGPHAGELQLFAHRGDAFVRQVHGVTSSTSSYTASGGAAGAPPAAPRVAEARALPSAPARAASPRAPSLEWLNRADELVEAMDPVSVRTNLLREGAASEPRYGPFGKPIV